MPSTRDITKLFLPQHYAMSKFGSEIIIVLLRHLHDGLENSDVLHVVCHEISEFVFDHFHNDL